MKFILLSAIAITFIVSISADFVGYTDVTCADDATKWDFDDCLKWQIPTSSPMSIKYHRTPKGATLTLCFDLDCSDQCNYVDIPIPYNTCVPLPYEWKVNDVPIWSIYATQN